MVNPSRAKTRQTRIQTADGPGFGQCKDIKETNSISQRCDQARTELDLHIQERATSKGPGWVGISLGEASDTRGGGLCLSMGVDGIGIEVAVESQLLEFASGERRRSTREGKIQQLRHGSHLGSLATVARRRGSPAWGAGEAAPAAAAFLLAARLTDPTRSPS